MDDFIPPFLGIDFQITNRCNARCGFCECWKRNPPPENDIPGSIWIDTVRKLKKFTDIEYVCIGGGEPFLYGELFHVLRSITDLGVASVVVTNGSLCTSKTCMELSDTGVTAINFSLDGLPHVHDQLRGVPGLFQKCIDAIRFLKQNKPDIKIGISTLICEMNLGEIGEFLDVVLENKAVEQINFQAYEQVTEYSGGAWWLKSPLWPKDKHLIEQTMSYLAYNSEREDRIVNRPDQFENFKSYFLNPESDLGIKCSAGTFNFAVSYRGDVIGCIAEEPLGNILHEDPVQIYRERFSSTRKKALTCRENCHFLINCFPLHLEKWEQSISRPPRKTKRLNYRPGPIILPPEIKEKTQSGSENYPDLINYEAVKAYDKIGKDCNPEYRKVPFFGSDDKECIYLCGDTSEVHRWSLSLDEDDFFRQIEALKRLDGGKHPYLFIVGVTRTNFHRLNRIFDLIRKV